MTASELKPDVLKFADHLPGSTLGRDDFLGRSWRWRRDRRGFIPGGARRTYIPNPRVIDRLLFGITSPQYRHRVDGLLQAANKFMADLGVIGENDTWANRAVINQMPPNDGQQTDHGMGWHIDPSWFTGGALVFGFGPATFSYRDADGGESKIKTGDQSVMRVPPELQHRVTNGNQPRVSIAFIHDEQLAAGRSATGIMLDGYVDRVRTIYGAVHQKIGNLATHFTDPPHPNV